MYKRYKDLLLEKAKIDNEIRKIRIINVRAYAVLFEKSGIQDAAVKNKLAEMERALSRLAAGVVVDDILDGLEDAIEEVVAKS